MSTISAGARRGSVAGGPPSRRSLARPVLLAAVLLWVYLGFASTWSSGAVVPVAWALLGAYLVPTALVVELSRRRSGVAGIVLLRILLLGSLLAAVTTATLSDGVLRMLGPVLPAWATGVLLPALAEVVAVILVVRALGRRLSLPPRAGLFVGGALGAGYAAFASLASILRALGAFAGAPLPTAAPPSALLEGAVTLQQALLAPLGHPVWGALLGAAAVAGGGALTRAVPLVLISQLLVAVAFTLAGGLLGTSWTALIVQTALPALVAAPAVLTLRSKARRGDGVDAELAAQAGGA